MNVYGFIVPKDDGSDLNCLSIYKQIGLCTSGKV